MLRKDRILETAVTSAGDTSSRVERVHYFQEQDNQKVNILFAGHPSTFEIGSLTSGIARAIKLGSGARALTDAISNPFK